MFNFINNDVIAGIVNLLLVAIPAIVTFLIGLKKFSKKALDVVSLAKEVLGLAEVLSDSVSSQSPGGKKITAGEIRTIQEKLGGIKVAWEVLNVEKLLQKKIKK